MTLLAHSPQTDGNMLARFVTSVLALATQTYARHCAAIGAIVLCAYMLLTAASVVVQPEANWDMLPYIAVAGENAHADPAALHAFAYGVVKEGVNASNYRELTTSDAFRLHMSETPDDFVSLLGMYRVKILYTKILESLFPIVSPVTAIYAVSVFSTLAFGAATLLWLRYLKALMLAPFLVGILIMGEFGDAARVGTPDMLCAALLLAGMYAHVRKFEAGSALLLFLAFLARPDNIVFVCLFALLVVTFKLRAPGALIAFAASLVSYFLISNWAGHPGWWPHLYFSTVFQQLNMNGFHPDFSFAIYAKSFAKAAYYSIAFNSWLGVVCLMLGLWLVTHQAGFKVRIREGIAFAALSLSIAAKFMVFPIHDTRVYLPALIPMLLLLLPSVQAFGQAAFAHAKQQVPKGREQ